MSLSDLTCVILAGGYGTRLSEETSLRPKPMVEIGGLPILQHIMQYYSGFGVRNFVIACGYKADCIKRYFVEFHYHDADVTVSLADGRTEVRNRSAPDWTVHCIDTGLHTMTGGRLKAVAEKLGGGTFLCTYGDGLSDVDVAATVDFHRSHGRLATVTAVHPPARFGLLELDGDRVSTFAEKRQTKHDWINGGFFVFEAGVIDYVAGPKASLELDVLERVAEEGELCAYRHDGFFQPMDTLREKHLLEEIWQGGEAPWVRNR